MIYYDPRDGGKKFKPGESTSERLVHFSKIIGVDAQRMMLDSGDAYFEGYGPHGKMDIGVERKTVHDMLHCIDDGRYNQQRVTMRQQYDKSFLVMEGIWKMHDETGMLMQGKMDNGKISWWPCDYRSRPVLYSKLFNYLISVAHSGVIITYPMNLWQTAYHICQIYKYHQKKWTDHTSTLEVQKLAIPTLTGEATLTRKWASSIDGVGVKYGMEAERIFKRPVALATSSELDWLRIVGIGVKTAKSIMAQIRGTK